MTSVNRERFLSMEGRDTKLLFGGSKGWSSNDWTASDDRVRGGASQSFFSASPGDHTARFYGQLDIEKLGGAGFASQRTASDELSFDLGEYDGIELLIAGADSKKYTFILKDTLLPRSDNGREQANVSYEYDFVAALPFDTSLSFLIRIPWADFKPTFRGREKDDAKPLDTSEVKRLSFMVRSFFGSQSGDFSFAIDSISAYKGGECDPLRDFMNNEEQKRYLEEIVKSPVYTAMFPQTRKEATFPYPYRDNPEYKRTSSYDEKHPESDDDDDNVGHRKAWLGGCCG